MSRLRDVATSATVRRWVHRRLITWFTRPPAAIARNFRPTSRAMRTRIESSLRRHFYRPERVTWADSGYLESEEGRLDLDQHVSFRLEADRRLVIPWLDASMPLRGARVLEIGCGTGSSTVALAEQGAKVTALDIDEESMAVARDRVRLFDLSVTFRQMSAVEIGDAFVGEQFDLIVYWASLEHMTRIERDVSIQAAWTLLAPGGKLAVYEAPNRLWYEDSHTSFLPFFSWLPDDLAVQYAKNSPRHILREFDDVNRVEPDQILSLTRHGRAVSFHDLEVALGPLDTLHVESAMDLFNRKRYLVWNVIWRFSADRGYEQFLRKRFPRIHPGFFQPYVNVILAKHDPVGGPAPRR